MNATTQQTLARLSAEAAASPRRRKNMNLHESLTDRVQRLFNAMEPGTYVRPHRHRDKWELFMAPRGALVALIFDDNGRVLNRYEIGANREYACVEIPPDTWHTLIALEPGTTMFEVKPGPYLALSDKDFASWAAAEGDSQAASLEHWFRAARPGEAPPDLP